MSQAGRTSRSPRLAHKAPVMQAIPCIKMSNVKIPVGPVSSYSREFHEVTLIFSVLRSSAMVRVCCVSENLFECGSLCVGVQRI